MILALKMNNNDYYPLCEDYLDIMTQKDSLSNLKGIDDFTSQHDEEEIKSSIIRSNILPSEIIDNSQLVIIYKDNEKIREFTVNTLDNLDYIKFDTLEFILQNISNKNIINQIQNHFSSKNYLPQDLQQYVISLNKNSIIYITVTYNELIYISKRILKDYIFNEVFKRTNTKKLERNIENNVK